jgi:formylglycine-generating enzyme required for sulfatase activity
MTRELIFALSVAAFSHSSHGDCVGDLYSDGRIDGVDLGALLAYWGPVTGSSFSLAADLTRDGFVDGNDLGALLSSWGLCPAELFSVAPPYCPVVGGTSISIVGRYLEGVTSVWIDGIECPELVVVNGSRIDAIVPAGALGPADVSVQGPRGVTVLNSGITYIDVSTPAWATLVEPYPSAEVVTDPSLRAAIVATGMAWRVRDSSTQIEMLLVPPGSFERGCSPAVQFPCGGDEYPPHRVTISAPFYLGRFEVTQSQWQQVTGSNGSAFRHFPESPLHPAENISWLSLQGFLGASGMRLPSEAEWEYACRASTQTAYSNGSNDSLALHEIAWFDGNSGGRTHPVGSKAPNRLGFHDMLGNVWEWVNDWMGPYSSLPQVDPLGPPSGHNKIFRGGSWLHSPYYARSSSREHDNPGSAHDYKGVRVARDP